MNELKPAAWYVRFGFWLCEKAGHFPDYVWIQGGYCNYRCSMCRKIISERTSRKFSDE